jgi:hypothetical protein
LALTMNGVDVSRLHVGDMLELDQARPTMMVECGWGEIVASRYRSFLRSLLPRCEGTSEHLRTITRRDTV